MNPDGSERRGVLELFTGSGIAALLSFGYLVYAARTVGPVEYADVSASLALLYFFTMAFSPVTPTISRFVAMYSLRNEVASIAGVHRAMARMVLRWTAPLAIAAALCSFPLQRALHFRSPFTVVLVIACTEMFLLLSVERGVIQGLSRFRTYSQNAIIETSIRLLLAILLLSVSPSATFALISYGSGLLISFLLLRSQLRREWRGLAAKVVDRNEVVRFAAPMLLLMIAFAVFQNADMLAAKRWLPGAEAGLYGAASGLARLFAVITAPFFILIVPRVTALEESGQPITIAVLRVCGWFLLISAAPLAAFAFLGAPIIRYTYGVPFGGAAELLLSLSLLAIVSNLGLLLAQAFASAHRFWILRVYATGAVIEIVALIFAHQSALTIVRSVLPVQTAVVALMAILLPVSDRRRSP